MTLISNINLYFLHLSLIFVIYIFVGWCTVSKFKKEFSYTQSHWNTMSRKKNQQNTTKLKEKNQFECIKTEKIKVMRWTGVLKIVFSTLLIFSFLRSNQYPISSSPMRVGEYASNKTKLKKKNQISQFIFVMTSKLSLKEIKTCDVN